MAKKEMATDDLAIIIKKQFDRVDGRFEKIGKNMVTKTEFSSGLSSLRSEMNSDISSLRSEMNFRFDKLDEEIADIKIRLGRLEKNLNEEVMAFGDDIINLRKRVAVLEKQIKVLKLAK